MLTILALKILSTLFFIVFFIPTRLPKILRDTFYTWHSIKSAAFIIGVTFLFHWIKVGTLI